MRDVFDVQEDIARCIAQALRISLSPHEDKTIRRTSPRPISRRTTTSSAAGTTRAGRIGTWPIRDVRAGPALAIRTSRRPHAGIANAAG